MYFADPDPLLNAMAAVIVPGGLISLLVRNGDALAMRPGLLGNWAEAFESASYTCSLARREPDEPIPIAGWLPSCM